MNIKKAVLALVDKMNDDQLKALVPMLEMVCSGKVDGKDPVLASRMGIKTTKGRTAVKRGNTVTFGG